MGFFGVFWGGGSILGFFGVFLGGGYFFGPLRIQDQDHHAADLAKVHLPKNIYINFDLFFACLVEGLFTPEEAPQD